MRRELERFEIPREHEARERSWRVVEAAFTARMPHAQRTRRFVPALLVAAALAAVAAAVLSPPGRAVIDSVREAIGVESAEEALFRLPAGGPLLVSSDPGTWVVERDGAKRLLDGFRDPAWSPFGRFLVAVKGSELVAMEPDGDTRWTLARRLLAAPSWGGNRTDTRIAYVSAGRLRVVGGDGRGDREVGPALVVRPAWRPRSLHVVSYADAAGSIVTVDVSAGARTLWRTSLGGGRVDALEWSSDGRRLLVARSGRIDVLTRDGARFTGIRLARGAVVAAGFRPGSHAIAYAARTGRRSQVVLLDEPSRVLFSGPATFSDVEWSPDGRWLLAAWRNADQWLFLRAEDGRVRAVANVRRQFESTSFPTIEGWCCP